MFTEDEAKTKWCPMFRAAVAHDVMGGANYATNRDEIQSGAGEKQSRCIASACMAWQWQVADSNGIYWPTSDVMWISAGTTYATEPNRPSWMTEAWNWDRRRGCWLIGDEPIDRGFCGAFRKVEP